MCFNFLCKFHLKYFSFKFVLREIKSVYRSSHKVLVILV